VQQSLQATGSLDFHTNENFEATREWLKEKSQAGNSSTVNHLNEGVANYLGHQYASCVVAY